MEGYQSSKLTSVGSSPTTPATSIQNAKFKITYIFLILNFEL